MSGRKRHRFDQTRALVRAALREGLTQDDIRKLCRVQQSVVSQWANGKRKAYRHQVEPLLIQYGHLLPRAVFTDYLVADDDDESWKSSAPYRLLADWLEANPEPHRPEKPAAPRPTAKPVLQPRLAMVPSSRDQEPPPADGEPAQFEPAVDPAQAVFETAQEAYKDAQVERVASLERLLSSPAFVEALPGLTWWFSSGLSPQGDITNAFAEAKRLWQWTSCRLRVVRVLGHRIFHHTFAYPHWDKDRRRWRWSACRRWTVHQDHGRFWLIDQHHRVIRYGSAFPWPGGVDHNYWAEMPAPLGSTEHCDRLLEAPDDTSRWSADAKVLDTHRELLDHLQSLIPAILRTFGPHAAASVRASIRLALVRQGLSFDGVEVLTSPG